MLARSLVLFCHLQAFLVAETDLRFSMSDGPRSTPGYEPESEHPSDEEAGGTPAMRLCSASESAKRIHEVCTGDQWADLNQACLTVEKGFGNSSAGMSQEEFRAALGLIASYSDKDRGGKDFHDYYWGRSDVRDESKVEVRKAFDHFAKIWTHKQIVNALLRSQKSNRNRRRRGELAASRQLQDLRALGTSHGMAESGIAPPSGEDTENGYESDAETLVEGSGTKPT